MADDLMRYDLMSQEAMRQVVRQALEKVEQEGLPGEHHFYITFDTQASGVRLSSRMLDKYPEEMTIVVQHQFWDLETTDSGFSIGLSFDNVPEALSIPFAAIRGFFDPSVQFGLQFEASEDEEAPAEEDAETSALPSPPELDKITDDSQAETKEEESSADVVSLDAFRKK